MKKAIISIAVIAAVIFAASCQKENLQENNASEGSASIFTATIETVAGTKATVERIDGTQATYKTKWDNGDEISINGTIFTATPASDATKATFTKKNTGDTEPSATFHAYFPANLYNNGTPTLPANVSETWADGKYNMPMYATSETASLSFKNLCGVLKITVTNTQLDKVKCITVSSTNCATSGAFTVSGDAAVLADASKTSNTVTVTYTDAVNTDATGKVFYVAIPAQTYQNLSIAVSDGTTTKVMTTKKDQDITVARKTVYPITFNGQPTTGTAERTSGNVNWIQLWAGGPKFAEYNVGAANNEAVAFGGYYAWGGNQDVQGAINPPTYKFGTDTLSGADDTATNLWGSNWRMPTKAEFENLLSNCIVVWTAVKSMNGRKFTGKGAYASNSVFLPAASCCTSSIVSGHSSDGYYWSSTPSGQTNAFYLNFGSIEQGVYSRSRSNGYSVRAVLVEED